MTLSTNDDKINVILHYHILFILQKQCVIVSVNHNQFLRQMKENSKHKNVPFKKLLQALARAHFPSKLCWSENSGPLFSPFSSRMGDQELFLAINFDGKIILQRTSKQFKPVASNKYNNYNPGQNVWDTSCFRWRNVIQVDPPPPWTVLDITSQTPFTYLVHFKDLNFM